MCENEMRRSQVHQAWASRPPLLTRSWRIVLSMLLRARVGNIRWHEGFGWRGGSIDWSTAADVGLTRLCQGA
jgi:hypothetical protein